MYRWTAMHRVATTGVIGIFRTSSAADSLAGARAGLAAGLDVLEVPLTTPNAGQAIHELVEEYPEALIGAGTVLDAAAARESVAAGAQFLVSPSLHPEVISTGHRYGVPVIPGASTPTEVVSALEAGADAIKIFPASTWSPGSIRDLRAALPQAPLVVTGGIAPEDAPDWIRAGAVAVGLGSALTKGGAEQAGSRVRTVLQAVAEAR